MEREKEKERKKSVGSGVDEYTEDFTGLGASDSLSTPKYPAGLW